MDDIHLERLGGLGGFGGTRSAVKSTGDLSSSQLSSDDREIVKSLFEGAALAPGTTADGFRYRITWDTPAGTQTIEVPESVVPPALKNVVKDRLR